MLQCVGHPLFLSTPVSILLLTKLTFKQGSNPGGNQSPFSFSLKNKRIIFIGKKNFMGNGLIFSPSCFTTNLLRQGLSTPILLNDCLSASNNNKRGMNPAVTIGFTQGVRNRREIELTRFALPYDYTCFADGTSFE